MDELINNIITLTIYGSTWLEQSKNGELLVIHTIFWPLHTSEMLTRDEPISLHKIVG